MAENLDKYKEIIDLEHHVSPNRQPMSMYNRAAQFAPFAALNGHDEAIKQTAAKNLERYSQPDEEDWQQDL